MAYDEGLAERIRLVLEGREGVTEKKMFGGIAFLLEGRMFCGIVKEDLMVRVGTERYEGSLRKRYVRPMDFTGKPMAGYVFVAPAGLLEEEELSAWVNSGVQLVSDLPKKTSRRAKKEKPRGRKRS